jgi:hypothetical protein
MSDKSSKKILFVGKTTLMKELQRTVAFRAYNSVLTSGNSKGAKALQANAHQLYFGNENDEDSLGYAEQLVEGMNAFAPLFEKEEDIAKGTITLTLKKIFHCLPDKIIVSKVPKDKGINMAVLSSKGLNNRVQITPRGVWDFGKQVEKMGKKALALVQDSEYADGKMPSGKTYEDYLFWLREAMYEELKKDGNEKEDDESTSDAVADSADNGMKETWSFPGFIAFALWGPIIPEEMDECHKAEAFWTADMLQKGKTDGRAAIRNEEEIAESVARSKAPISEARGISNKDFLFAASIAQQSSNASMINNNKSIDRRLKYHQDKVKRAEREVERWRAWLTNEIIVDPTHLVNIQFTEANNKFHKAEEELDSFMSTLKNDNVEHRSNPYQALVDKALSTFQQPEDTYKTPKITKRKRSETPSPLSSIEINDNESVEEKNDQLEDD